MRPVPPELNRPTPGHVLIVGRDPGEMEVAYRGEGFPDGRPFVGPAGAELEKVLSQTGLRREDVNITNVCGFRPPDNEFKAHDDRALQGGLEDLRRLTQRLKPSLVICLGNEASYAILGDQWPTQGRGIYGAKDIMERRGYFWPRPGGGWALTTLHPSGVLHQPVPGAYLMEVDFRRARKWLAGKLPREMPPEAKRLDPFAVRKLLGSELLGWDIETKWGMTQMWLSGFCGDDLQPYIGIYPQDKGLIWNLLQAPVRKCGHNGWGFDLPCCEKGHGLKVVNYTDDTQNQWWSLEPELAGKKTEKQDEDGWGTGGGGSRMTRKALAFIASVYDFNLPWWKHYPDENDSDEVKLGKLWEVNRFDTWLTRYAAASMLPEIAKQDVMGQYQLSMGLVPWSVEQHLTGMLIAEPLRQQRIDTLQSRGQALRDQSAAAALKYIVTHQIEYFRDAKQCECCGGGKVTAKHCWRCAGLAFKPTKKPHYQVVWEGTVQPLGATFKKTKIKDLVALLPECKTCQGVGKVFSFHFNPMSVQQVQYLMYQCLGVPKTYQKGKVMTDEMALRKILRWCKTSAQLADVPDGAAPLHRVSAS